MPHDVFLSHSEKDKAVADAIVARLECGVIVNRAEEEKLNSPAYRKRLADAIGRAIQNFSSGAAKDN
jgi:hypothetical protein